MNTLLKKNSLWMMVALVAFGTASVVFAADKPAAKKKAAPAAAKAEESSAGEAQPAAAAPAPATAKEPEATASATTEESSSTKSGGLLGPVSLGPTVALALPHPVNFGIEGRFTDYLGFAINYGYLPTLTLDSVSVKFSSYDARVRVFPFGGAFFVGASIGRQTLSASNTVTQAGQTATVSMDLASTYLTPTLGWRWGGRTGFIFGMDFGWQMSLSADPINVTTDNAALNSSPDFVTSKANITKAGNDFGNVGLPSFTVVHIGYLF